MTEEDWAVYLAHYDVECPSCGTHQEGLEELERGRLSRWCPVCNRRILYHIWASTGWIYAPSAGIILEED
jgi:rubredoxin